MSILNAAQINAIKAVQDSMLDDWSVPCKIWYQPIWETCTECLDNVTAAFGGLGGLSGGPAVNLCPYCNGTNKREKEVTDTINLEIDYTNKLNRQDWLNNEANVKRPFSVITVKGYLTDLPKLQKAVEIQINIADYPHVNGRYIMMGQADAPYTIVKGRYFLATLKRHS